MHCCGFLANDPKLSVRARALMMSKANTLLLSAGSLWESAGKVGSGKLTLARPFAAMFPHELYTNDIDPPPIEPVHAIAVASLPFHHRDPFDRLLIAQASVERIPVVSADVAFDPYGVTRLW